MPDNLISVDEFLTERKDYVKSGDVLMKASKAPASWNKDAGTARFTMSAEVEDRDRDIVMQDGISTDEFIKNPVALLAHNSWELPIGSWSDVAKNLTGRPKRMEGTLTLVKGDEMADRVAVHLGAGSLRACSIGFIPKAIERREVPEDRKDAGYYYPGYKILECELVECSPCAVPANPAALAKAAAGGDTMAREILESVLDTWAKHSETGLLIPRSEFEAAWKTANGDRTTIVTPTTEEAGMFRRFLSFMAGDGGAAAIERKRQEDLALSETAETERKALEQEFTALEGRLAAKGI